MNGLRFWGTPKESYDNLIYYWVSNESTVPVYALIENNIGDLGAASSYNPATGSNRTPMFLQNHPSLLPYLTDIEYRWYDASSDGTGVLFIVVMIDWYIMPATPSGLNDMTISGLVSQNRAYIKQVLVPNPTSGNNICYKNYSHRTVYLEFWNTGNTAMLYRLEVPSMSTIHASSSINLSTVGFIRIGSYTDDIGGYHYGVAQGAASSSKGIIRQVSMPVGGGNYFDSSVAFSGNNTYYPLHFYTEGNALTGGTFG